MKTIAVDIDDVIAEVNESVRLFMNENYGHTHQPDDYKAPGPYRGYWESVMGIDADEGRRRFERYLSSGVKRKLKVADGAIRVLTKLSERYELVIITSRQERVVDDTHFWLDRHFPKLFKQIEFVYVWSRNEEVTKARICQEIGASYLIDDSLEHCSLAASAGLRALLFGDYGWHKAHDIPSNVVRVRDWSAVEKYFDRL